MDTIRIAAPLDGKTIEILKAGDQVFISGIIYTARDAAHKRLVEALDKGLKLPFDVRGQVIYYMGPSPAQPGHVIGSAGPTTSGRMDAYTPRLIEEGLKGMIGKGDRTQAVKDAINARSPAASLTSKVVVPPAASGSAVTRPFGQGNIRPAGAERGQGVPPATRPSVSEHAAVSVAPASAPISAANRAAPWPASKNMCGSRAITWRATEIGWMEAPAARPQLPCAACGRP